MKLVNYAECTFAGHVQVVQRTKFYVEAFTAACLPVHAKTCACPCEHITCFLSTFIAAEYGDAKALAQALNKRGAAATVDGWTKGITPLHLAAQHGHVVATCIP